MSDPFDVIALGETMLSVVATDAPMATATAFRATHGGAETNALVGLARSGLRTAWVGRLGTDVTGDRVAAALGDEGVSMRWVARDPDRPTGVMLRDAHGYVEYRRSGSAASALSTADLDGVPIAEARAVLVTGITALIGDEPQRAALELLDRAQGVRAVDPHLRPGLWGSERGSELVLPLVAAADLVLGGESELQHLLDTDDLRGESLARRCLELGPSEIVVKRGHEGAGVLDREGRWYDHAPEPEPDVDPVGAGDAFNAGYLATRLRGGSAQEALVHGAACGAAVAGTIGDTEGFPRGPIEP